MFPVYSLPHLLTFVCFCFIAWSALASPAGAEQNVAVADNPAGVNSQTPGTPVAAPSTPAQAPSTPATTPSTPASTPNPAPISGSPTPAKSVRTGELQASSKRASSPELISRLRGAKVVDASANLDATVSGEEILITTQSKPHATEADAKIQAVLLSKTAFDAIPSGPQRCKIVLFDSDFSSYNEITVKRAEVKMFGSGELSQKDLLSSLEVKSSKAAATENSVNPVVPGPMQPERIIALERINRLKAKGTNISVFKQMFEKIEDAAQKDNAAQVKQQLITLNEHLKDQEQMAKNASSLKSSSHSGETQTSDGSGSTTKFSTSDIINMADQAHSIWHQVHHGHHGPHGDHDDDQKMSPAELQQYNAKMKTLYQSVNSKLQILAKYGKGTQGGIDRYNEAMELLKEQRYQEAMWRMTQLDHAADVNLQMLRREQAQ